MENDVKTEGADLSQKNEEVVIPGETSQESSQENGEPQDNQEEGVDYRGKLNIANRLLEREGYAFKDGKWLKDKTQPAPQKQDNELSQIDMLTVLREGLDDEAIQRAVKFSKLEGVTVSKAIASDFMQDYIKSKKEEKRSAAAANAGKGKGGQAKLSDDALLEKARTKTDLSDEEFGKLWLIRKGIKTS